MDKFLGVEVCLFDFDGTLVDTMGFLSDLAAGLLSKCYGLSLREWREEYIRTSGRPFFLQLELMRPGGYWNEELAREFEEEKREIFKSGLRLEEGVIRTLEELRRRGKILVISSGNSKEIIEGFLAGYGFKFDEVLGYEEGCEKGEGHFEYCQKKFGVGKEGLLLIGDSLWDEEEARRNGVIFIGKLGTFERVDFRGGNVLIEDLEEILNWVR